MAELSIIIEILAALLTGGFLMIFIENQKTAGSVTERFHFVMNPFFRSFTNYVKFISFFKACFTFKVAKDSEYIKKLKDNVDRIGRLGVKPIVVGQDFPADHFTAKELDSICNTINNIWYLIDGEYDYIDKHLAFDSHYAEMLSEHTKSYLEAISPKYKGAPLAKDLLAKVSGDFFVEIYQPIKHILPQYEFWQQKEKEFQTLALVTVGFTLLTMILVLLQCCYIPIWIYNVLCVACCGLLMFELYKLIRLENLSKTIMR